MAWLATIKIQLCFLELRFKKIQACWHALLIPLPGKQRDWADCHSSLANQIILSGEFQVSERSCLKTNKVDGFWEWHLRLFSDLHVQTYTHTSTHIHTQVYTILVTFPDLKSRSLENGMYLVLWGCEENWSHQDRVTWLCRTRPTKYWMPTSRWPLCIFVRAIYLWFAQWKQPGPEIRTGDRK